MWLKLERIFYMHQERETFTSLLISLPKILFIQKGKY